MGPSYHRPCRQVHMHRAGSHRCLRVTFSGLLLLVALQVGSPQSPQPSPSSPLLSNEHSPNGVDVEERLEQTNDASNHKRRRRSLIFHDHHPHHPHHPHKPHFHTGGSTEHSNHQRNLQAADPSPSPMPSPSPSPMPSPSPSPDGQMSHTLPRMPLTTVVVRAAFVTEGISGLPAEQAAVQSLIATGAGSSYQPSDVLLIPKPVDPNNPQMGTLLTALIVVADTSAAKAVNSRLSTGMMASSAALQSAFRAHANLPSTLQIFTTPRLAVTTFGQVLYSLGLYQPVASPSPSPMPSPSPSYQPVVWPSPSPMPSPSPSPDGQMSHTLPRMPLTTVVVRAAFVTEGISGLPAEQAAVQSLIATGAGSSYQPSDVLLILSQWIRTTLRWVPC